MIKYASILLGAVLLTACSSEPSDYRPNQKVSDDAVAAGTRPTGLYPSKAREGSADHAAEGHGDTHGAGHSEADIHQADASEAAAGEAAHEAPVAEPAAAHEAPAEEAAPATETPAGE